MLDISYDPGSRGRIFVVWKRRRTSPRWIFSGAYGSPIDAAKRVALEQDSGFMVESKAAHVSVPTDGSSMVASMKSPIESKRIKTDMTA